MQIFCFECTALEFRFRSGSVTGGDVTEIELALNLTSPMAVRPCADKPTEETRWVLSVEEYRGPYADGTFPTVGRARRIHRRENARETTYSLEVHLSSRQFERLFSLARLSQNLPSIEVTVEGLEEEGFEIVSWGEGDAEYLPITEISATWPHVQVEIR